jgi:general nucleoside transport system permease protein
LEKYIKFLQENQMIELAMSTFRLSIPIIFAAMAGLLSERSGVANVALEALLLTSAFVAAAVTAATQSLVLGCLVSVVLTALLALIFTFVCEKGRGDQIVIGMAFNLLVAGMLPIFCKSWFAVSGSTPPLSAELSFQSGGGFFLLAVGITAAIYFIFKRTLLGLRISAAGENPLVLSTQGLSYLKYRYIAAVGCGAAAAMGGISLSLWQGSGYIRDMSAGRGFIALAALIFGGWRPLPTLATCLFFAFADAIQIQIQGTRFYGFEIPNQLVQTLPYVFTLLVLVIYKGKMQAPAAINQPV